MQLTQNGDEVFDDAVSALKLAMKKQKSETEEVTLDSLADLIQQMRENADTPKT
jgi:hypothetical protein